MSNWTHITADNLKALGHGAIVDAAQTVATGGVDPVTEAIADAVARVRAAVARGNALDVDAAKVPNSLRSLTARMAVYALMERIGQPLSDDQRDTRRNDNSYLLRIGDEKMRFESPDTDAGNAEMQQAGALETLSATPRDRYTREGMNGL